MKEPLSKSCELVSWVAPALLYLVMKFWVPPVVLTAPPAPTQLAAVNRQTVSVDPPAMLGIWTMALPAPVGFKPCRTTSLALVALARFRLPTTLPGLPTVIPPAPWTARVPVKVGLLVIVRLLQLPPVPRVMALPPPDRLPVPLAQVRLVLPCTAVLAMLP